MEESVGSNNKIELIRAEKELKASLGVPLIILTASRGYGKTTLVHDVLNQYKQAKQIWLTLDQYEEDHQWLWRRLCEKLSKENQVLREGLKDFCFPHNAAEFDYLIRILRQAIKSPCYLVLDNYNECINVEWNMLIEKLAAKQIPNLHMILICQYNPDIAYEELWMKGLCNIIEQQFFVITKDEFQHCLKKNRIDLEPEESDRLYSYTDGWLAAICLILMKYKMGIKIQNPGTIAHLLKSSIYDRLPDWLKEVFMKMSIFPSFQAEQAAFVCRQDFSTGYFCQALEGMAFVHKDSSENYTMHALLRIVAEAELEKAGLDKKELYGRCGRWHEKEGQFVLAIRYYKKAGKTDSVFRLLEQKQGQCFILYERAPAILNHFFQSVPIEVNLQHPRAFLPYIYMLLLREDYTEGRRYFLKAREAYHSLPEGRLRNYLLGELHIIEAVVKFNNLTAMTFCIKKAYELLNQQHSHIFDMQLIFTYGVPEILQLYHFQEGKLKRTVALGKEYTHYFTKVINGYECGWDQLFEAEYHFTTGKVKEAESFAEAACEKAKMHKQLCALISSYFVLLRCYLFLGKREQLLHKMEEFKQEMAGESCASLLMDYDLAVSFIYGRLGYVDKMTQWIQAFQLSECNNMVRSVRCGCVTFGILLIKTGQWMRLETLAEEMYVPFHLTRHVYVLIYSHIYRAISAKHLHGLEQAACCLRPGIELAAQDGIVMTFAEYAEEIAPVLNLLEPELEYAGVLLEYCRKFQQGLSAFFQNEPARNHMESYQPQQPVLTKREWELMELVKFGYMNADISRQLNIALVTVEKTLSNVYRKLGVKNRTAAIAMLQSAKYKSKPVKKME